MAKRITEGRLRKKWIDDVEADHRRLGVAWYVSRKPKAGDLEAWRSIAGNALTRRDNPPMEKLRTDSRMKFCGNLPFVPGPLSHRPMILQCRLTTILGY